MNAMEIRMKEILCELKTAYGALAVKAEFEAEGSRLDELIMLNKVVFSADMDLIIKIGGCEAMRDLDQCRLLGANGIMAPMIETPFAMKKFCNAAAKVYPESAKQIEWIINTETVTCNKNFDDIMKAGQGFIDTIAIGRVDLSASMGLDRSQIDGKEVFEVVKDFAVRAKKKGLRVGIGGGISLSSIPFMMRLKEYVDKFETRKIVFRLTDNEEVMKKAMILAMEFELLYLKNKCTFYNRMAKEDESRVVMLEERYRASKLRAGV